MTTASREQGPLVSVAIPVYNGQALVAQSLRSVLAQTHRNLEIIVVDDGSTDGTWDVLQSFGPSIRAIRQSNGGLAAARSTGVQAAQGEFIALMDHDDLCAPERIAAQVKFMREQPQLVLCSSDFSAFNANGPVSASHIATYYSRCSAAEGGVIARYPRRGSLEIGGCMNDPPDGPLQVPTCFGPVYDEIALGNFVHPPTVMFRRSVLKEAGGFEQGAGTMCDWDWLVRVAREGEFGFIERPLLQYRLSASQMSANKNAKINSVLVAKRICERDPQLFQRQPERFRQLLGELYADAAEAIAEKRGLDASRFLAISVLRYRTVSRQSPRTLVKAVTPAPLIRALRTLLASR
jgi:glycosyltransferase involved in cell wall biosynthesis